MCFLNGNFYSIIHITVFKWLTKNKLTFMQMTWGRVGVKPLYGFMETRTQDNSYPGQLVPKTTRTHDNLCPRQLVLRTTRTQDNSYPRRLEPRRTRTQGNSYPRQLVPRTTRTLPLGYYITSIFYSHSRIISRCHREGQKRKHCTWPIFPELTQTILITQCLNICVNTRRYETQFAIHHDVTCGWFYLQKNV